jgi:hypothetical protein
VSGPRRRIESLARHARGCLSVGRRVVERHEPEYPGYEEQSNMPYARSEITPLTLPERTGGAQRVSDLTSTQLHMCSSKGDRALGFPGSAGWDTP